MKPILIDDFSKFKFLSNPCYSPDGKRFLFTVSECDMENNKYLRNLYCLEGKETKQLTFDNKVGSFLFLDNDNIVFTADRDEKHEESPETKFYKLPLNGGEARKFLTLPLPAFNLMPLKNGNYLFVGSTSPDCEDFYKGDKKVNDAFLKARKENEDFEEVKTVPWWWNGSTFTKGAYDALYLYNSKTKKVERLTQEKLSLEDISFDKERNKCFYSICDYSPLLKRDEDARWYELNLDTLESTLIFQNKKEFSIIGITPCDSFALVSATNHAHGINSDCDFYKMDYDTKEISLYAVYNQSGWNSVGSDVRFGGGRSHKAVGDVLYWTATLFDSCYLCKLDEGKITKVLEKDGSVESFDIANGNILLVGMFDMKGQELYNGKGKQLTNFNKEVLQGKYVAKPEILNFYNSENTEIHGFVLKPKDYQEGKKYPVIFDIHGGPKTVYGPVFYHEMQLWASMGYFVIFCNPTGSDGRGEFFDINGKYGTIDYEDLMTFCDKALEAYPDMDKDNLFETGGSYGGFMTNWIIGHTDRFKACASQRSISDWISFWGVSDIGTYFAPDQCKAEIWENMEKLWWHSPLKYADKVKTPTLFIHSFEDYRCPINQGYEMYSALIKHGVESKMVLFKGENHDLSRTGKPKHRLKRLKEITDWFESHKA